MKRRVSSPVLPSVMRVRVHLPPCCNSPGMHLGQGDDRTPNGVISGAPARFSPASVLGGTPSAWWRSIPTRPAAEDTHHAVMSVPPSFGRLGCHLHSPIHGWFHRLMKCWAWSVPDLSALPGILEETSSLWREYSHHCSGHTMSWVDRDVIFTVPPSVVDLLFSPSRRCHRHSEPASSPGQVSVQWYLSSEQVVVLTPSQRHCREDVDSAKTEWRLLQQTGQHLSFD